MNRQPSREALEAYITLQHELAKVAPDPRIATNLGEATLMLVAIGEESDE